MHAISPWPAYCARARTISCRSQRSVRRFHSIPPARNSSEPSSTKGDPASLNNSVKADENNQKLTKSPQTGNARSIEAETAAELEERLRQARRETLHCATRLEALNRKLGRWMTQRGRSQSVEHTNVELPEWFVERNVMLHEDLIHHELPSFPIPSDQFKDELDLHSSLFSTPSGAPPDSDPKQAIRGELLRNMKAKYLEVLCYLSGSFAVAEAAHPRPSFPASKGHLALYWPHENGTDHLAALIQLVSGQLNADFIRLDAQDLAELGSNLVSSDDGMSHRSISTLGYDTYDQTEEFDNAEEEEDSDDLDPREAEDNPKAKGDIVMPGLQIPKDTIRGITNLLQSQGLLRHDGFSSIPPTTAITIGGVSAIPMHDATDGFKLEALLEAVVDAAQLKKTKAVPLGSSTLSPTQIQRAEFRKALFAKATTSNLDFLFGRAPDEAQASENESNQHVPKSTKVQHKGNSPNRTVIFIPDFMDLSATPQGSRVISLLVDIAQQRRNAGEQMVIVGASTSLDLDTETAAEAQRRLNEESEVSRFRALLISVTGSDSQPSRVRTSQSKADLVTADAGRDEIRNVSTQMTGDSMRRAHINWRNICHMLGQMVPGTTDLDRFSPPPCLLRYINQEILSRDEVHQVAITAIGLYSLSRNGALLGKPLDTVSITEALLLLETSHLAPDSSLAAQNAYQVPKFTEPQPQKPPIQSIEGRMASVRESGNRYEKRLLSGVVLPRKISTTFEDVHVAMDTIEALKTLTSLSLQRPEAFKYGVLKSDTIPGLLLYGPPGTGKTLLARAVAKESGAIVLRISGSDVNQMYVGEGEKTVKAIFSLARKLSPCIVFIDEADSIFASRSMSRHRPAHRDTINQFLQEWDGMDDLTVFLMIATNRPFDLDDAVLRRLPRRLLIDLPDSSSREAILRIHLKSEILDSDVSLPTLASETPFYSGSDLKNLAVAAALAAVREENERAALSTDFKYPEKRTLKKEHFEKAKQEISASISEDMQSLNAIRKFDEEFGSGNRRKRNVWGFGMKEERKEGDVKVRP